MQKPEKTILPVMIALAWLPNWTTAVTQEQRALSKSPTPAKVRIESWQRHQQMKNQSPFQELKWELVGPRMSGGRIESIAVPLTKNGRPSSTLYVGAGSGGVWKTVNNGITWKPIFDDQPTQAIGDIAIAPSDPNVVWVGTGEVLMARSSLAGLGVFKSEDGGETWQCMGLEDTHHIGRVVIDPRDPNVVYVAAIGHRYSGNENRGLFKTTDGGKSWTKCLYRGNDVSAIDLVLDPADSKTVYVTTWQRDLDGQEHYGSQSAIYKSTDAGENWVRLQGGLPGPNGSAGRIAIDVAPTNRNKLYALYDNAVFEQEKPRDLLFASEDAGKTWNIVNDKDLKAGWDWCEIRVSPDDENQVYSIGQNSFLSRDGGKTFKKIGGTIVHLLTHGSKVLHLDTHSMWIDPTNPDRVLFGNDGGLYLSYDRCENWLHLNNLPITECYALTHDEQIPFQIYIGTQDNAALFAPHDHRPKDGDPDLWKHVYLDPWGGGDSYFTFRDPTDVNSVYYEHQYGVLRRKNMKTGKTENIRPGWKGKTPLRNAWMTPFFPSRHAPATLYYAANHVFKSTDRGSSWESISPDLAAGPKTVNLRYQAITTLAESSLQPGNLYAGTDNGNLFRTEDDGKNWIRIDQSLPRCNFRRVFPSTHQRGRLFVALSGLQTDDFSAYLFRSDDHGKSWKSISGGLPDARFNIIVEDPRRENILFAGSDLGVYVSLNGGQTWHSLSNGLPAVSVHDLLIHPQTNQLFIATHGRGVFVMDVSKISHAK